MTNLTDSIAKHYDGPAKKNCCLSCGGAFSLAAIEPGNICVDLGCGKGHDVLRMANLAGEKGHAYGVDFSRGMLESARMNAGIMRVGNVTFIQSSLEEIALGDELADVVISNCTINHSLRQDLVWREVYRILKPGGVFVVSDIFSTAEVDEKYRLDPEAVAGCWAGAETREKYLRNVTKAGFKDLLFLEESAPYSKGAIELTSFTLQGNKSL